MSHQPPPKLRLFTSAWLQAMLRGERTTGETFWVGNYGTALFHQPVMALLLVMPISEVFPGVLAALLTLYQIALFRAVALSQPGVPTPFGWKLAGLVVTLVHAVLFAGLARSLILA